MHRKMYKWDFLTIVFAQRIKSLKIRKDKTRIRKLDLRFILQWRLHISQSFSSESISKWQTKYKLIETSPIIVLPLHGTYKQRGLFTVPITLIEELNLHLSWLSHLFRNYDVTLHQLCYNSNWTYLMHF